MNETITWVAGWVCSLGMVAVVGAVLLKGCQADNERLTAIGKACVENGGAWVGQGQTFQCVSTTKK